MALPLPLNDSAPIGEPDVLRSTHQGPLISCGADADVLTQPTPPLFPARPACADLALRVGCVSHLRETTHHANPREKLTCLSAACGNRWQTDSRGSARCVVSFGGN